MPTTNPLKTQLSQPQVALLLKHLSSYVGEDAQDLLSGDFDSNPTGQGAQTGAGTAPEFLNTTQLSRFFQQDEDKEFVFAIRGTVSEEEELFSYFPILQDTEEGASGQSEGDPDTYYKSVLPPTKLSTKTTTWYYVYFSTENAEKQEALWAKLDPSGRVFENLLDLQEFAEDAFQYQQAREAIDEETGEQTVSQKEAWRGGLYFSTNVSEWPFAFIDDEEGFLGIADPGSFTFTIYGNVFHPKYEGYTVHFPVLHAKVQLVTKDYKDNKDNKGSETVVISRTELSLDFYSKSDYSDEPIAIILSGKLFLEGNKYELDISAGWPIAQGLLEIDCKCKIHEIPFFDHTQVPGLEATSDAEVDVALRIDLEEKSFYSLGFIAELDNWPLVPDVLALKELKLSTLVFNGEDSHAFFVSVDAKALLGKNHIELDCGASYPEGDFYFALNQDTPIHLHEVVEGFFGNHGGMAEGLVISGLEGGFNYHSKELYFLIELADETSWELFDGIALNKMSLSVGGQGSLSANLFASLTLGTEMSFTVAATLGDGWSLEADYENAGENLNDFFEKFNKALGPNSNQLQLPDFIGEITIDEAKLSLKSAAPGQTDSKPEKHFSISGSGGKDSTKIKYDLKLDITYPEGVERVDFSGHMTIAEKYEFDIIQQKEGSGKLLLAAYHQEVNGGGVNLGEILGGLGVKNPPDFNISLKDAFFVNDNNPNFNLLVADVGAGLNLSNLPLVGKVMPADTSLSVALRVLYADNSYKEGVAEINELLPDGIAKIAKPESDPSNGLSLQSELRIGAEKFDLELDIGPKDVDKNSSNSQNAGGDSQSLRNSEVSKTASSSDNPPDIKWFKIGKKFGPVLFNRVGLSYANGEISVYPDAALSMGGLEFVLDGLSVTSPVSEFKPKFDLKGLGLDFKKGPLEIGASFLRQQAKDSNGNGLKDLDGNNVYEYDGLAIIKTSKLSISALGSYAYLDGHSSLFIYAYLDQPLGGPSFFFVEGLAAGFGYNRALIMPEIDKVSTFPLVRQVMEGSAPPESHTDRSAFLTEQLDALAQYVPPKIGETFFAIGIKFNSFKLIDSFILLAIQFGNHFEIDVLGQSNIVVPSEIPPDVPPLAEIKIQLMAKFLPEEGTLAVLAQLTNDSYIFSKDCHLTGGAAFYSWFKGEHAGDFVVTLGGYHPAFNVPAHYPQVPRLALNWQISEEMSIKGDMYFALCAHAFMAGGHLEALYHHNNLQAWFKAGADFLIQWQPYHYDAHLYLDIGATYTYHLAGTHHITVDLGADVHIWGPKFAGEASIHIWVVDIKVAFGEQGNPSPQPIAFAEFQTKCLPAKDQIISASITQGVHNKEKDQDGNDEIAVVNAKELKLVVESAIPVSGWDGSVSSSGLGGSVVNVAPMNISGGISSIMTVTLCTKREESGSWVDLDSAEIEFLEFSTITKKMPAAIWGTSFTPDLNATDKMVDVVAGLEISAKASGIDAFGKSTEFKFEVDDDSLSIPADKKIPVEDQVPLQAGYDLQSVCKQLGLSPQAIYQS